MARNTRFCFSGCSNDSQSPRIWSSLSGIHRRMLGCQGMFSKQILRTNSVHCEEIWRNMKLKSLKSGNIDMNLMILDMGVQSWWNCWNAKWDEEKNMHVKNNDVQATRMVFLTSHQRYWAGQCCGQWHRQQCTRGTLEAGAWLGKNCWMRAKWPILQVLQ